MTDNEIKREQPSFEVRAESLKERTKNFFSTYENPNGSEDRLEICLIREGYRTVLKAEEIINRQKAENEELQTENKQLQSDVLIANQNYEHIKEIWEADKTRLSEKIKEYIDKHNELITKEAAIRAEAVKEFAARLRYVSKLSQSDAFSDRLVTVRDIDDLEKELVGGKC